jgi:hypothetical protein
MPSEPFIREKFIRESYLPSQTIEFTMKRLREPVEAGG